MKTKIAWAVQSFLLCFAFNLAFAAVVFFMAGKVLEGLNDWVSTLAGPGGAGLPEDLRTVLAGFGTFLVQLRRYMLPVLAGLASSFTLIMWFFIFLAGGRQIRRAGEKAAGLSVKSGGPVIGEQPSD